MRVARVALPLVAILLATSCDNGSGNERSNGVSAELANLVLRRDEAPAGSSLDEEASGAITLLREVLPSQSDAPQLPPLPTPVRRGFLGGYDAVYDGGEESGLSEIASSVLRFGEIAHAGAFLGYLREAQTEAISVGTSETFETPGLGEEGYGWHRTVPGGETSGCSWRRGDLVFTLTLAGPLDQAPAQRAVELARRIDQRL